MFGLVEFTVTASTNGLVISSDYPLSHTDVTRLQEQLKHLPRLVRITRRSTRSLEVTLDGGGRENLAVQTKATLELHRSVEAFVYTANVSTEALAIVRCLGFALVQKASTKAVTWLIDNLKLQLSSPNVTVEVIAQTQKYFALDVTLRRGNSLGDLYEICARSYVVTRGITSIKNRRDKDAKTELLARLRKHSA